jgi:hypothetical protein
MAVQPCVTPTDSIDLTTPSAPGAPASLEADLRVSLERGNSLRVHTTAEGARGVTDLDGYSSSEPGVGVRHPHDFWIGTGSPPFLGVTINVVAPGIPPAVADRPIARLPGAGGDRLRVGTYDNDDLAITSDFAGWKNLFLAVADATNPRIDRIVLTWGTDGRAAFSVKTGVPTTGATLDNLLGAAAIDTDVETRWADVLVDAGALTITSSAKIRDRRPQLPRTGIPQGSFASAGIVAQLRAKGFNFDSASASIDQGTMDNQQSAALMELDCDVMANFLYFTYRQRTASTLTGNYIFALFDLSKRLIGQTAITAWSNPGAGRAVRNRLAFATGTLLRAGLYYGFFGLGATAGSGIMDMGSFGSQLHAAAPNVQYHRSIGSTNVPQTFTAGSLTDAYVDQPGDATSAYLFVPRFAIGDV